MDDITHAPLDTLIDAVIGLGGPLTGIVSHMAAHDPSPDAPPIPTVLREVLGDVLDDLRDGTPAADLETAARVLEQVTERVCSEIHLVPPEAPPINRAERRRRRRR